MSGVPSEAGGTKRREPDDSYYIAQLWLPLAKRGHAKAQYIMGSMFLTGRGAPRHFGRAMLWFSQSAEQGYADAQLSLGLMYLKGQGALKNAHRAAYWLRCAAEQGMVRAQCYVSRLYALGIGVPRSYVYSYMWAMLAASGGRRSLSSTPHNNEKLRTYALNTLEGFARQMNRDEVNAAVRMAKKWRQRFQQREQAPDAASGTAD